MTFLPLTPPGQTPLRVLTIAGSDSGGGAGIQADMRTFALLGLHGLVAVTAVTVQNSVGVKGFHEIPLDVVAGQIEAVASDIGLQAAKTGMLASSAIIETIAQTWVGQGLDGTVPLVVDPVYQSPLVTQLVNKILLDGKKSTAERIVYGALEGCREKTGTDPVVTLKRALDNVKPAIEVKSRRVGGATYQVPIEVKPGRATTLSLRWLVGYARQRREKTMTERLMNEILDASNGLGAAVKRREDTHKMAESNKAFAHYRW